MHETAVSTKGRPYVTALLDPGVPSQSDAGQPGHLLTPETVGSSLGTTGKANLVGARMGPPGLFKEGPSSASLVVVALPV